MANLNTPFGFSQAKGTGSSPTYEQVTARINPANNIPIYSGDAVSYVTPANGYIQQAAAGTAPVAGIFVGCEFTSVSQKSRVWRNYWPGNDAVGDVTAYLINDPNAQFEVQAGGQAIDRSKIGQNVQLNPGVGNPNTGRSGMYVENPSATATLPFRIVNVVTNPPGTNGTDLTSPYNKVIVAFNNAVTRNNGATPGIA
jgi:hypothetical protein